MDGTRNVQLLNLGPIYQLGEGETLASVARQFRTTVKSLLQLNPDLVDPSSVRPGQELCMIPCSSF